jgi:hypothetical protein
MSETERAAVSGGATPEETGSLRHSSARRVGCAIAVLVWAILMLIPFFLFLLALRGEITIDTGSAPEQRLRVWLIMDATQRGIGISTASASERADGDVCVQTEVRFILWQGRPEASREYCECHQRTEAGQWVATGLFEGACPAG